MDNEFIVYIQGAALTTGVALILTLLAFIFKWGFRFRLVGITGFMGVLTVGLFGLSLGLFSYTDVPGAVPFNVVYDNGGSQVVIKLPPTVTESEVEASLRKASADLFSYGRLGGSDQKMVIRARTVTHPEEGVSKPLYLGKVQRSRTDTETTNIEVDVFSSNFSELPDRTNS
ncbi:MAG: Ycf51 family protein [Halothece sp.]